jgi:HlyD family secretion protein
MRTLLGILVAAVVGAGIGAWAAKRFDLDLRAVLAHAQLASAASLPGVGAPAPAAAPAPKAGVAALGRIQPKDGLIRVAGPALPVVVVKKLLVEKGDFVKAGDPIAILDGEATRHAELDRAKAELANAESEMRRSQQLRAENVVSESKSETISTRLEMARANVHAAEAELERTSVRAPIAGQVIDVYARDGMRVPPDGIVALGRTDQMYAIAEVFETDVVRVRLGQRATVSSPAWAEPLHGTVDRIGMRVGKLDAIGADPAARTDARVVEVEIRLDESAPAAALTNLQVEIGFEG